jgi:hypothetical protein
MGRGFESLLRYHRLNKWGKIKINLAIRAGFGSGLNAGSSCMLPLTARAPQTEMRAACRETQEND